MSWIRCLSVLPNIFPVDNSRKPTIVVAGYGWASHSFLQTISFRKYNVKVISERDKRLNQNQMIGNLMPSYTPPITTVIQDTCVGIDNEKKTVRCKKGDYAYDYLVVATGSEVNDFGIPGVKDHCLMCKTDTDVNTIRERCKKDAVILGAGPTGIELACSLRKYGVQNIRIVEAAPTLLPGFSDAFREYAENHLRRNGVKFYFNTPITNVTRDAIVSPKCTIPYNSDEMVVWTCGIKPVEFARTLNSKGILVNENLQYSPFIYVIGDSCRNAGPPTAQNASQQGRYLAEYFNDEFLPKKPYVFNELGRCLDLGDGYLIEIYGLLFFIPHIELAEIILNLWT